MRAERKGAVNGACKRGSVAAAARTAASARAAATGRFDDGQGLVGFDGETEIADVDGDAADLLEQVLGNDESEAVSDLAVVVIRGFVEGEAETGAVFSLSAKNAVSSLTAFWESLIMESSKRPENHAGRDRPSRSECRSVWQRGPARCFMMFKGKVFRPTVFSRTGM